MADVEKAYLIGNTSINKNTEDLDSTDSSEIKRIQRRAKWSLFTLSVVFFLVYTGFYSLANLQSTMNAAGGIGVDSQAVIFICSMFSSLFLPTYFIEKFGCKNMLICGTFLQTLNIASNMYLSWGTMIPSAVLLGIVNGPFAAAITFYIDEMGTRFQSVVAENLEFIMAVFFGFVTFSSENTQIWGNLISYYVLKPEHKNATSGNASLPACGIHFDASEDHTNINLDPPTDEQRFLLVGIYTGMGALAVLIVIFFMEPLDNDLKERSGWRTIGISFLSAFQQLKNPHQLLLIPITVLMGMEGPFYGNEITQAYIACSWGVHHVGFVTICFGVCGALMSLLVGPLVKWISQMAVLILAACANVGTCILLFLWEPSPDSTFTYFLIAGIWGMGDAIWWSQVTALYGLMFPNDREAAFSNLYFWSFLGFFLSYSYANYLTVAVKINILLCFLITGMIGYLVGQAKIKCTAKREYVPISQGE